MGVDTNHMVSFIVTSSKLVLTVYGIFTSFPHPALYSLRLKHRYKVPWNYVGLCIKYRIKHPQKDGRQELVVPLITFAMHIAS
jgi:hypothetical protein